MSKFWRFLYVNGVTGSVKSSMFRIPRNPEGSLTYCVLSGARVRTDISRTLRVRFKSASAIVTKSGITEVRSDLFRKSATDACNSVYVVNAKVPRDVTI